MKKLILCAIATSTLTACSGGAGSGEKIYDMPPEDARRILLSTDFEPGVLPGSKLKPRVQSNNGDGSPEWQVLDEARKNGWWCPLSIEPADEAATRTRVVNKCEGLMSSGRNRQLDELVDAALTDRAPKFD